MGIKLLNRFLRENCNNGIKKISFIQLSNKKIVIDTSIYMYRFLGENQLLENFYLMCSIFLDFHIKPLFVFDGKPPKEKYPELKKRKEEKKKAKEEYEDLEKEYKLEKESLKKQEIQERMDKLRQKFIKVTKEDKEKVKELLRNFGMSYIDAPGEADELCSYLTIQKKAFACMSEDMDMFAYGCPNILRYLSLLNQTCVLYNMKEILHELDITKHNFRQLCVLSGTDYGKRLKTVYYYYGKYIQMKKHTCYDIYDINSRYVVDNTTNTMFRLFDYICELEKQEDIEELKCIYQMFCIDDTVYRKFQDYTIQNSNININQIKEIMKDTNFVFLE